MQTKEVFHGTNGDVILTIIGSGQMKPKGGKLFFSERRFDAVFMHGADAKRGAAFSIKVRIKIPDDVKSEHASTPGVGDTLIVHASKGISATVLELYVRARRATSVQAIKGARAITAFLKAPPGAKPE